MTDHHDELASAYLDGQLSPDEAARVEGDPRLMAEVEALAAAVERLQTEEAPVDPATRQRHLAAAMAVFDQVGFDAPGVDPADFDPADLDEASSGSGAAAPTNVIPLDPTAGRPGGPGDPPTRVYPQAGDMARRAARVASAPTGDRVASQRSHTRRRQGLPTWLSAAAALLVVGGGIGWFLSRDNQSDDTAALSAVADEDRAGPAGDAAALAETAEGGGTPEGTALEGDGSRAGVESAAAAADQAQEDAPAAGATPLSSAPTTAVAPSTTTRGVTSATPSSAAPGSTTAASGGLSFGSAPTGAEVQDRLEVSGQSPQPPDGSSCGGAVSPPAGSTLTGYVPLTVGGVAGEALFFQAGSGSGATTVLVVRTSSCQAFS